MTLLNPHEFLDVGYMAEDFVASNYEGKLQTIKRSDKEAMAIFTSFCQLSRFSMKEIEIIDSFLQHAQVPLRAYIILKTPNNYAYELSKTLQKCQLLFDTQEEFSGLYGIQTVEGVLAKTLFVIGKEGAIYHVQTPQSANEAFDLESLRMHLNKTYQSYNGTGCHG